MARSYAWSQALLVTLTFAPGALARDVTGEATRGVMREDGIARGPRLGISAGSDSCVTAVDLSALLTCDGSFYVERNMGIPTASPSAFPTGSCWLGDPADNDVWYQWTNAGAQPKLFLVSTDDAANVGGDSQIAVYTDCAATSELACSDDDGLLDARLSDTGYFLVLPGQTIFIQFDGWNGDRLFDLGQFRCVPATTLGDNCQNPIGLGLLGTNATLPVVRRRGEMQPAWASDYNEIEPTFLDVLDQPETCYTFQAFENSWVQIAASPTSNNGRVIFSDDLGITWRVSHQCWKSPVGGYDTSPQFGTQVTAGTTYCFCIDSAIEPLVDPGDVWDLELYSWPLGALPNATCATEEDVDFCANPRVTFPNLNTAGAGQDPGIDPGLGCGGGYWANCSGFGADINYVVTWTQRMADCGCTGFQVTQSSPDLGTAARVCDAGIQIATTCPPTDLSCVVVADDNLPGTSEVAIVSPLGVAEIGMTYHVQLDTYMHSACPSFEAILELLDCDLDFCGGTVCDGCTTPTGVVDNVVHAVRRGNDVELTWAAATVSPANFVVLRTALKAELAETRAGIGDEMLVATTTATQHNDLDAIDPPSPWHYKVLPAGSCDQPIFP